MKGDKLIKILETFSKTEIKEFRKYLSSTFLSEGRNHIAFYDELIKYYPDFNKKNFSIETISKNIKNPETLHFVISQIIKLAYDYLYFKYKKEDKIDKYIDLAQIARDRELSDHALNFCKEAEKLLEKRKINKEYYYNMFRINMKKIAIYFRLDDIENQYISGIKMTEYFSIYFMGQIIRLQDILKTYEGNYDFDYESTYFANLIKSFDFKYSEDVTDRLKIKKTSLVKIYSRFFSQIKEEKEDKFFSEIYEILEKSYDEIAPLEIASLATKLQNDWMRLNEREIDSSLLSFFESINKYILKVYTNNKFPYLKMAALTFRNIYLIAISLNEFKWAEEFIEKYGNMLYPEKKEDMIKWAYGTLYFHKKEFEKSLHYLNSVKDVMDMFKFDIRRDILKLNYELKYYDHIPSLIDSFRHFLTNTRVINSYVNKEYRKFIEYFSKLYNCTITKDLSKIRLLQEQVKKDSSINNDEWIQEKLRELIALCKF
jgi:hypothetical protein